MKVIETWETVIGDTMYEMAVALNNMGAKKEDILGPVIKDKKVMCLVKSRMEEPMFLFHQGNKALFEFYNGESVSLYAMSSKSMLSQNDVEDVISRFKDIELLNVVVSSSISEIEKEAFKDCKFHPQAKVQMSQSINKIGDEAFKGVKVTVEFNGFTLPKLGKNVFEPKSVVLEVPQGFSMDYNGNTEWGPYVKEIKKLVYTEK